MSEPKQRTCGECGWGEQLWRAANGLDYSICTAPKVDALIEMPCFAVTCDGSIADDCPCFKPREEKVQP